MQHNRSALEGMFGPGCGWTGEAEATAESDGERAVPAAGYVSTAWPIAGNISGDSTAITGGDWQYDSTGGKLGADPGHRGYTRCA